MKMEKSKSVLCVLILILLACIIGLLCWIFMINSNNNSTKFEDNQNKNNVENTTGNETESNSSQSNCDCDNSNTFEKFSVKMKENLASQENVSIIFNNIDGADPTKIKLGISRLKVDNKGNVILSLTDETLISKYGQEYKILSDVLTAGIYSVGNGGFRKIVFIKEDGTLSAIDGYDIYENHRIDIIDNYGDVKNIVSVVQNTADYWRDIMAIDINGNVYILN